MDEQEFQRCAQYLEAALEYSGGTHGIEDIATGVREGKYQLWPAPNAAAITEIIVYPRLKELHCFLAGGDLDELKVMRPYVEAFGKRHGCSRSTFSGRRGWERTFMKDEGYEPRWFIVSKEL
jgi:hypothetical protein